MMGILFKEGSRKWIPLRYCNQGFLVLLFGLLHLNTSFSLLEHVPAGPVDTDGGMNDLGKTQVARGLTFELLHRDQKNSPLREEGVSIHDLHAWALQRSFAYVDALGVVSFHPETPWSFNFSTPNATGGSTPVFAQLGMYLLHVTLGTPAQKSTLLLTTNNDLVWLQCKPCVSCFPQMDPIYDPSASSSYKVVTCKDEICNYVPGKTTCDGGCNFHVYGLAKQIIGVFSYDTLTLTTPFGTPTTVPNFAFGCGFDNSGWYAEADGMVALGKGNVSMMTQLAPSLGDMFSICLVRLDLNSTTKSSFLTLGDAAKPTEDGVQYTPLLTNPKWPSYYYVSVTGISVDDVKLDIPPEKFAIKPNGDGGTMIDIGSNIFWLIEAGYDPLVRHLKALITYPTADVSAIGYKVCYNVSGIENYTFPLITIHMDGADLVVPPYSSWISMDGDGDGTQYNYAMCLAATVVADEGASLLGHIFQQDHLFFYDRQNAKLGIKRKDCAR